jgi:hypothetical protein
MNSKDKDATPDTTKLAHHGHSTRRLSMDSSFRATKFLEHGSKYRNYATEMFASHVSALVEIQEVPLYLIAIQLIQPRPIPSSF